MKLMYDEGSLGEVETPSELAEYLQHYDSECFIGPEHKPGWEESILTEKPHLFSLGKDIEKVGIKLLALLPSLSLIMLFCFRVLLRAQ